MSQNPISQSNSTTDTKKRAKVIFEKPNNNDQKFIVHIKLLKTDKRKKNCLILGRNVVQTVEFRTNDRVRNEENVEFLFLDAMTVEQGLCSAISVLYEDLNEDTIEGTNGIWQVSNTDPMFDFFIHYSISCL